MEVGGLAQFSQVLSLSPLFFFDRCYPRSTYEKEASSNLLVSQLLLLFIMAAEGGNIRWFTYTGDNVEIDYEATHIYVQARVVYARDFFGHRNIVEVICHEDVKKIEGSAFYWCRSLRRVIMPGVKIIGQGAFGGCTALEYVECDELEIIGGWAFYQCDSLRCINLPSVRIVYDHAFVACHALADVKFGSELEGIDEAAFCGCESLEQITIPLKNGLFTADYIFQGCDNLRQVDLIVGKLHETIAALYLEEWRNDVNEEIDSINQILPDTSAGTWDVLQEDERDMGEKAQVLRRWIRSVLGKIIHYQGEHQRLLNETATALKLVLPNKHIVMNNILPFLELPSFAFEVGGDEDEDDSDDEQSSLSSESSLGDDEVDDGNIVWFTYTGADGEVIDDEATHVFVKARVVRARTFQTHENIVEVICHEDVEKIEAWAFGECVSLRRVVMPGVTIVEECAFANCETLEVVECDKLEIIGEGAFEFCESLKSINLPSARIVEGEAFSCCNALTNVKFGNKLERIEECTFLSCPFLERITIPLKDGLIPSDATFAECEKLNQVDLIQGELHETIAALQLEEWRNDMNDEIDSINQSLPSVNPGRGNGMAHGNFVGYPGGKAQAIRNWIRSILDKIIRYQAEHRRLLDGAATTVELVLPNNDIVMNNILPFLELPSYTFDVGNDDDDQSDDEEQSSESSLGDDQEA